MVAPVITGEIVSTTMRPTTVVPPVFATTIWYVTGSPIPGFAGIKFFIVVTPRIPDGTTVNPTAFVKMSVEVHTVPAVTYAVFDTPLAQPPFQRFPLS